MKEEGAAYRLLLLLADKNFFFKAIYDFRKMNVNKSKILPICFCV